MIPGRALSLAIGIAALAASACDTDSYFAIGRDLDVCEANLPTACGPTARCVLDDSNYITGKFPAARRFIVRTKGEADLLFEILFFDRRAPGTELRLVVYEPSCSEKFMYDSAGQDVFRLSGEDGIIAIPIHVVRPGDHPVELVSDSYSSYSLRVTKP